MRDLDAVSGEFVEVNVLQKLMSSRTVDRSPRGQLPLLTIRAAPKINAALLHTPDSKPPAAESKFVATQEQGRNLPTLPSGKLNGTSHVLQPYFAVAAEEKGDVSTVAVDHTPTSYPADRSHDRAPPSFQPYSIKSAGTPSKGHGSQFHPRKTTTGKNRDAPKVDIEEPRKDANKAGLPCWHHYHYTRTQSPSGFVSTEGCRTMYEAISQIP